MRNEQPIVCNTNMYTHMYGGRCYCDFDAQRKQFVIVLSNDDVGTLMMKIDERSAYYCTPELIFNRFQEQYIKALHQRAQDFYEKFTRELIERSIEMSIDIVGY